jgi:hypothetical protein
MGDKKVGGNNNFFPNNTTNALGRDNVLGNSRFLIELLSGQNLIKEYLKDLKNKTEDLVSKNKELVVKNKKLSNSLNNKNNSNNNSFNSSTNNSSNNLISNIMINNNSNNLFNNKLNEKPIIKNNYNTNSNQNSTKNKAINRNGSFTKILDKKEEKYNSINKESVLSAYITSDPNKDIKIKVSNSVLKKDLTGRPFLDYVCEVKNGKENYSINKKFGHFIMLHKALKGIFKDNLKLPSGGNLFINISDMKQNSFHENKLEQLDKYVSDLLSIEGVRNSKPFRSFFELDEPHEQKIFESNLGKYEFSLEKFTNK